MWLNAYIMNPAAILYAQYERNDRGVESFSSSENLTPLSLALVYSFVIWFAQGQLRTNLQAHVDYNESVCDDYDSEECNNIKNKYLANILL